VPVWYWDWAHPALVRQRIAAVVSSLECTDDVRGQLILRINDFLHLPTKSFWSSIKELLGQYRLADQLKHCVDTSPEWLWLRVALYDHSHKIIKVERSPMNTSLQLQEDRASTSLTMLEKNYYSTYPRWQNPDVLQKVAISSPGQQVPFCGYPALFWGGSAVETRIFLDYENAVSSQIYATERCIESIEVKPLVVQMLKKLCSVQDVKHYITSLVVRYVTGTIAHPLENERSFRDAVSTARNRIVSAEMVITELLEKILESFSNALSILDKRIQKYSEGHFVKVHRDLEGEINFYKHTISHEHTPCFALERLSVYLTIFLNRIDDAFYDYPRYCSKMDDIRAVKKSCPLPSSFSQAHYFQWIKKWRIRYQIEEYISVVFSRSSIKLQNPVTLEKIRELAACE
jgi:hypothetical protein